MRLARFVRKHLQHRVVKKIIAFFFGEIVLELERQVKQQLLLRHHRYRNRTDKNRACRQDHCRLCLWQMMRLCLCTDKIRHRVHREDFAVLNHMVRQLCRYCIFDFCARCEHHLDRGLPDIKADTLFSQNVLPLSFLHALCKLYAKPINRDTTPQARFQTAGQAMRRWRWTVPKGRSFPLCRLSPPAPRKCR